MSDKNEVEKFFAEVKNNIEAIKKDKTVQDISNLWMRKTHHLKYDYNFTWLGRPIIQMPQDIIAMQEIIWSVKPDLIIETGIAHGGSLIFHASILDLIGENGQVLGIDIDIREHNRLEIEKHPMFKRIKMIQGPSIDDSIVQQVYDIAKGRKHILVILDSNHTHDHVLKELKLYSPLVTKGSYLVVFDTIIEDMPEGSFPNRHWGKNNNPKTATYEFLKKNKRFVVDEDINAKLLLSVAPDGYLKCIKV